MRFNTSGVPSLSIREYKDLPQIAAVYLAVDADRNVHYIGKARNLRKRWVDGHNKGIDIALIPGIRIYWLSESVLDVSITEAEVSLIKKFKPPLNKAFCYPDESLEREFCEAIARLDFQGLREWLAKQGVSSVAKALTLLSPGELRKNMTPFISEGNLLPTLRIKEFPDDIALAIYRMMKNA